MRKNIALFISTGAGIALFILVFYLFNAIKVFSHLTKVGYLGICVFVGNVFLIMVIGGLSWQIIIRAYGQNLPFKDVLIIKIIGSVVSYLTPSMYIGGEPIRIYLLGRKHEVPMTRIGATVVVDKFLELGAGLFYIFLGSIYTLLYYALPLQVFLLLVVINALFVIAAVIFLVSFVFKKALFSTILNFMAKIKPLKKPVKSIMPFIVRLEKDIFFAFGRHKKSTIQAFLLNLVVGGLIFIKPAIFFYFLHRIFTLSELSLLFALTHIILAFQFTPCALGILEWGEIGIFSIIGVQSEKALAYTLMVRIADLLLVVVAVVTGLHIGVRYLWGKSSVEKSQG